MPVCRDGRALRRRRRGVRFCREQGGSLEQPAKIFFAGVLVLAVGEPKIGGGFVTDFESFELHDADVFPAAFPNLALLKLHEVPTHLSLDFHLKRDGEAGNYFFLPAACLLATAAVFFAAAVVVLDCFWLDFFWVAFGDLSPMIFWLSLMAVNSPPELKVSPAAVSACPIARRM